MLHPEFILHASRAFFASAWADQCDESEHSTMLCGAEIMDIMPDECDTAAINAARNLHFDMERMNGAPIADILARAVSMHSGDRPATMEYFAHYCAMQAMGHGVGLYDAFGREAHESIRVPYVEFGSHSLEKDYF